MDEKPPRRAKPTPIPPVAQSAKEKTLPLRINGEEYFHDGDPDMPLLWYLRDVLRLTGTKFGCGIGACGACTVLVDGKAQRACLTPVKTLADHDVTTIEGLASAELHPVQQAWIDEDVAQCGFCQPGQIMAAAALLADNPNPSDADIDAAMTNICRCGTYQRIRAAVHRAAEYARAGGKSAAKA